MPDTLTVENKKVVVTTEEGLRLERPEADLDCMYEERFGLPLNGQAFPDGLKFIRHSDGCVVMVHQRPPHVRQLRWIADGSPVDYGPGTQYRSVRLSMPYGVTVAAFFRHGKQLYLSDANELYFRNAPLRDENDALCYPALLNISCIPLGSRMRSWICTQHLRREPHMSWTAQLDALLEHTWNGGFNRSSERHEGQSMYGYSHDVPELHPVEKWEAATLANEAFALGVAWKPAPLKVGELMECLLAEMKERPRSASLAAAMAALSGAPAPKRAPASVVGRFLTYIQSKRPR